MPPEYLSRGQVSIRTDSFAFGIMIGELITGMRPDKVRELVDDQEPEEFRGLLSARAAFSSGSSGLR